MTSCLASLPTISIAGRRRGTDAKQRSAPRDAINVRDAWSEPEMLVAKIQDLYPAQGRGLDVALVVQAIDRRSRGRWDWKIMVAAWGNDAVDSVQWPIRWNEWRKAKGGTPIET